MKPFWKLDKPNGEVKFICPFCGAKVISWTVVLARYLKCTYCPRKYVIDLSKMRIYEWRPKQ